MPQTQDGKDATIRDIPMGSLSPSTSLTLGLGLSTQLQGGLSEKIIFTRPHHLSGIYLNLNCPTISLL